MRRSLLRSRGPACGIALAVLALTAPARAQSTGAFDTDLFRPQLSGLGLFGSESAHILPHLGYGFGLSLGYGHRPLVLTVDRVFGGPMVAGRLTGTATAALGLFGFLEAGAAVPYALFNDQRATDPQAFSSVSGFGTARFQLKLRLLTQARSGLGVSLIAGAGFQDQHAHPQFAQAIELVQARDTRPDDDCVEIHGGSLLRCGV